VSDETLGCNANLHFQSSTSSRLLGSAQWQGGSGAEARLILRVQHATMPNKPYSISFRVRNPEKTQLRPPLTLTGHFSIPAGSAGATAQDLLISAASTQCLNEKCDKCLSSIAGLFRECSFCPINLGTCEESESGIAPQQESCRLCAPNTAQGDAAPLRIYPSPLFVYTAIGQVFQTCLCVCANVVHGYVL